MLPNSRLKRAASTLAARPELVCQAWHRTDGLKVPALRDAVQEPEVQKIFRERLRSPS